MNKNNDLAAAAVEAYYDSSDADIFYERVWGGEDIHIGIYEPGRSIYESSRKTVELMASKLNRLNQSSRVLDLGAGYGGSARYLASAYGCHVTCLNLSDVQNEKNRLLNRQQQLDDNIEVLHGSFESIPAEAESFDIVWSQDAFLHSDRKSWVLREIHRVLKPGGQLIFSDPMQADDCPPDVLQPVYDRLNLESMGSFAFYRQHLKELCFEEVECKDLTIHLGTHYDRIGQQLKHQYDELSSDISQTYLDKMILGLDHWVAAENNGYLAWGILHFRKQ